MEQVHLEELVVAPLLNVIRFGMGTRDRIFEKLWRWR
jgi:hypothetical protein